MAGTMAQTTHRVRFRCRCGRTVSTEAGSAAAEARRCTGCELRHGDLARAVVLHRDASASLRAQAISSNGTADHRRTA